MIDSREDGRVKIRSVIKHGGTQLEGWVVANKLEVQDPVGRDCVPYLGCEFEFNDIFLVRAVTQGERPLIVKVIHKGAQLGMVSSIKFEGNIVDTFLFTMRVLDVVKAECDALTKGTFYEKRNLLAI